jgi:predicted unusual protein kinase regulating ubiquinone biosynthesis (AarF/ABC1/UbiB family)
MHRGLSVLHMPQVQKPYIQKQMTFDLLTYKFVVWWFEKIFDLPFYWTVDYTETNIRKVHTLLP